MQTHPVTVHKTLARSYLIYFVASVFGLFADSVIPIDLHFPFSSIVALLCFILGPIIMVWAQYTSRHFKKGTHPDGDAYFLHGPYKILRNPTHLGLLILVMGYTVIAGSVIFFVITLIGYLLSNRLFKRYESHIESVFGEHYTSYKESIQKIL